MQMHPVKAHLCIAYICISSKWLSRAPVYYIYISKYITISLLSLYIYVYIYGKAAYKRHRIISTHYYSNPSNLLYMISQILEAYIYIIYIISQPGFKYIYHMNDIIYGNGLERLISGTYNIIGHIYIYICIRIHIYIARNRLQTRGDPGIYICHPKDASIYSI